MKKSLLLGFAVVIVFIVSNKTVFSQEVKIGNQIWSSENLKVTKFRNGDIIPEAKTNSEWEKAWRDGKPAWTYYKRDPANEKKYGKIYNGYAVIDPRGIAPLGWHVPSRQEWSVLIKFLGGDTLAKKKLLSTSGWNNCFGYEAGSNSSGFNALPGGSVEWTGGFNDIGNEGSWWTSSAQKNSNGWGWSRKISKCELSISEFTSSYSSGFSVRCVKD